MTNVVYFPRDSLLPFPFSPASPLHPFSLVEWKV